MVSTYAPLANIMLLLHNIIARRGNPRFSLEKNGDAARFYVTHTHTHTCIINNCFYRGSFQLFQTARTNLNMYINFLTKNGSNINLKSRRCGKTVAVFNSGSPSRFLHHQVARQKPNFSYFLKNYLIIVIHTFFFIVKK